MKKLEKAINVTSEYAPLKQVIVAQSEFIFPQIPSTDGDDFLESDILELYSQNDVDGRNYADVFPMRQKQWEQERENLCNVLEKYGVTVKRPRQLTDTEKSNTTHGVSNFFVRDPFFTVGNHIIEGSMRFQHRKHEILPVRDILIDFSSKNTVSYLSIPCADFSDGIHSTKGPFLEGGDVLVHNKTVFVGESGLASNEGGAQWLKNYLSKDNYEVIHVNLHPHVLHLDCALSIVNDHLIIISEEAFLDGVPAYFDSFDKIIVPLEDVAKLAVNGLPISDSVYIMDPEFEYIETQLRNHGITVELIDFKISRSLGGSFRCSTQALERSYD